MTKGSLKRWIACISIIVLLVSTLGSDMSAIRVVHASGINDPAVQVSEEPLSSAEPAVMEEPAPAEEAAPSEETAVPKEPAQQEPENQEPISNTIGEALQTETLSDAIVASSDAAESASDLMASESNIAGSEASSIAADIASTAQTTEEQALVHADNITILYAAGEGGKVSLSEEMVDLSSETVIFQGSTATALEGYKFINWMDENAQIVSSEASFVPVNLTQNRTYTANFEKDEVIVQKLVSVTYAAGKGGTVSRDKETVDLNSQEPVFKGATASAKEGYVFAGWESEDGKVVSKDHTFIPQIETNEEGIGVDALYTAMFEKIPEVYPAQDFSGTAGDVMVNAHSEEGAFPEGTRMEVSAVTGSSLDGVMEAAQENTENTVVDAVAVDITFYNRNGDKIEPANDKNVSVQLHSQTMVDGDDHEVVHVEENGNASTVAGADAASASFTTDAFTIYAIIGTDTNAIARSTYHFYIMNNGVKTLIDTQIVKKGDTLVEPDDPVAVEGHKFLGWYIGDEKIAFVNGNFTITQDSTADETIDVYAKFDDVYYVIFYKDSTKEEIVQIKSGKEADNITTDDVTFTVGDSEAITGWKYLDGTPAVSPITLTNQDIELIPIIAENVVWVEFDSKGGTAINAVYTAKGGTVTKPADPTRDGYRFMGWYITENYADGGFDFSKPIMESVKLYAKWQADKKVKYTVVYWRQNAEDNGYTFAGKDWNEKEFPGERASTYLGLPNPDVEGFILDTAKTNAEAPIVSADGSTIMNVYYSRKIYPLTFNVYNGTNGYDTVATIMLKYQQDTATDWNSITGGYSGYLWYISQTDADHNRIAYSSPPRMEPTSGTVAGFTGIVVYGRRSSGSGTFNYLDNNTHEEIHPSFTFARSPWEFTTEDYIAIPGYRYHTSHKAGNIGYIYYKKNAYNLTIITNNQHNDQMVRNNITYKDPLSEYEPDGYVKGVTTKLVSGTTYYFAGWYSNEACAGAEFDFHTTMPALDNGYSGSMAGGYKDNLNGLLIYGKWIPKQVTVTFDLAGGNLGGQTTVLPQTFASGMKASNPGNPVRTEYGFNGWRIGSASGALFNFDNIVTQDTNLVAAWYSSSRFSVIYRAGAHGMESTLPTDNKAYSNGANVILKAAPQVKDEDKKNWNFYGWKVGDTIYQSGTFTIDQDDADSNHVIEIVAQYIPRTGTTQVIYDPNGGTGKVTTDSELVNNADYMVRTAEYLGFAPAEGTRADYTFEWNTKTDGSGKAYQAGATVAVDLFKQENNILYACWTKKPETTIYITGHSLAVVYDGNPHTVSGYDLQDGTDINISVTLNGTGKDSITETAAGTYEMTMTAADFTATSDKYSRITIRVEPGKLTITKASAELNKVTATGYQGIYDGVAHTITASAVQPGSTFWYSLDEVEWSVAAAAYTDVTVAKTIYVKATNANFEDAFGSATVTIDPRSVTLSSGSASKTVDGTPLTSPGVNVGGDGFVAGEVTNIRATGTITAVGSTINTIAFDTANAYKAANYNIARNEGVLTITAATGGTTTTTTTITTTIITPAPVPAAAAPAVITPTPAVLGATRPVEMPATPAATEQPAVLGATRGRTTGDTTYDLTRFLIILICAGAAGIMILQRKKKSQEKEG